MGPSSQSSSPRTTRAKSVAATEWLLTDLKLVGGGWLVETLDALIPSSLPDGGLLAGVTDGMHQIATAASRAPASAAGSLGAVQQHSWTEEQERGEREQTAAPGKVWATPTPA